MSSPHQDAQLTPILLGTFAAGELGSLEEVVKEFIHKQFLRPVMLHEVGGQAACPYVVTVGWPTMRAPCWRKRCRCACQVLHFCP